jgi:hypothetical protein
MTAIRTRDEITTLIRLQEHALHTAEVLYCRRATGHNCAIPVVLRPSDTKF